jgi:hypothetical protein
VRRGVERQQLGAQRRIELAGGVGQHPHAVAFEVGQHAVHPVERGAGHQADEQVGHAGLARRGGG